MDEVRTEDQENASEADIMTAVRAVEEWGRSHPVVTGVWVDRRVHAVNVGISDGDEIETTDELQHLAPLGVHIRARPASAKVVQLRRFQVEVAEYLHAEGIWSRWAVELGPDRADEVVTVGLRPTTPPDVVERIKRRFPTPELEFDLTAAPARAVRARATRVIRRQ